MPSKKKSSSKRRPARKPASRATAKPARKSKPKTPMVKARKTGGELPMPKAPSAQQLPPPMQLMQMLTGFMVSRSICAAAELSIADKLKNGPLYYTELAKAIGANQKTLHRLMRALSAIGIFAEPKPGTYALTPLSDLLRSDVPGSMKHLAEMMTTPSHWLPWGRFDEAIIQGISAADKALGKDVFSYFADNPEEGRVFNAAMSNFSAMSSGAIAKAYDFRNFERIVDVGGGHGFLLSTVLRHAPNAKGVLYDLPEVVKGAGEHFADIKERVEIVGGDFFKAAPEDGDAYYAQAHHPRLGRRAQRENPQPHSERDAARGPRAGVRADRAQRTRAAFLARDGPEHAGHDARRLRTHGRTFRQPVQGRRPEIGRNHCHAKPGQRDRSDQGVAAASGR